MSESEWGGYYRMILGGYFLNTVGILRPSHHTSCPFHLVGENIRAAGRGFRPIRCFRRR